MVTFNGKYILVQLALLSYSSYLECLGNLSGWYYVVIWLWSVSILLTNNALTRQIKVDIILCGSSQGCSIALITVTPRKYERWTMINSPRLWSQHCSLNYRKEELQSKCFVLLYFITFLPGGLQTTHNAYKLHEALLIDNVLCTVMLPTSISAWCPHEGECLL